MAAANEKATPTPPALTSNPNEPLPTGKASREEHARIMLEHTVITPLTAWALISFFLITIGAVPFIQHVVEIRTNLAARRQQEEEQQDDSGVTEGRILPQSWDALPLFFPSLGEMAGVRSFRDAESLLPRVGEIKEYESALEEQSVVSAWVRPPLQSLLTGLLGAGNEQVYPGIDGWLHYRSDVDYVTHRGFLDPEHLEARGRAGDATEERIQPDPVRAIVHFKEQLARRGITLIVMPVPVKPMIHPETLSARYKDPGGNAAATTPLQNPSWQRFQIALEREGVLVFDASPLLSKAKQEAKGAAAAQQQYLKTDTHWRPEAMERVARSLAAFVETHVPSLPHRVPVTFVATRHQEVTNTGDIAQMLKLPEGRNIIEPERVVIHPVLHADGEPWQADRSADILLLGDSFSNIYSLEGMGWGAGAGFCEHLSAALKRPLDRIIINAGGSYTTRQRLRADLLRGKDRLTGKRLVIYQFAARDLVVGDWKILEMPLSPQNGEKGHREEEREP